MPVPSTFADLSTTPASNSPAGTEAIGVTDDHLRTLYALVASIATNSGNGWSAPYLALTGGALAGNLSVSGNLAYTGSLTGSTGQWNIGSGQLVKSDSGCFGVGTPSTNVAMTIKARGVSNANGALLLSGSASGGTYITNVAGAFYLSNDVGATHLAIDTAGNMLVGYTGSNGDYKLQVNSQIFATSGTIATSDAAYKENVSDLPDALSVVCSLRPVAFDWKPHPVHQFPAGRTVGFIAQEVQSALSGKDYAGSVVKQNSVRLPDGSQQSFLGIAEGNLIALLVGAVKALEVRVSELESADQ